jgi:hypothetical protein
MIEAAHLDRQITISTTSDEEVLEQRVDIAGDVERWIVDTRDVQVRDTLIGMGWTPPAAVSECFVDKIERALGIAQPDKTRVSFATLDFGRRVGVSLTYPSGKRHAVTVEFQPGWDSMAIAAALEWQEPRKAELGLQ